MVINKYSLGILFVVLTAGSLLLNSNIINDSSSIFNHGTDFDQWRPNTSDLEAAGCNSCHQDLNTSVGTGTLNINNSVTVDAYSKFILQAKVTGFTQASSGNIVIGFNGLDNNNSLFSVTTTYGTDFIASIKVDASGNSNSNTFNLTAPGTAGNYTLKAYAVHATLSQKYYYLSDVVTVNVKAANVTLPTSDIITYKVDKPVVIGGDKLDSIWASVPETQVSEFGSGGFIKTLQDGTYLYTLLAYDPSYTWIGIEFNATANKCMVDGSNGWIFGTGTSVNFNGDYYFVGESTPVLNTGSQVFFNKITGTSMDYIVAARSLTTTDPTGHDFQFNVSQTFNVVFASNVNHESSHKVFTWTITDVPPTGAGNTTTTQGGSSQINLQQISDIVVVLSVVIVIVTVFIHISLRVVSKPIKHERRIVYSNKIPNYPGSIPLIKKFLGEQKRKIFKPKPKTQKKE